MLLYISLLLIFFSLILVFHNWNINKNAIYLAITFILIALYGLTHYFTVYGGSVFWMALFYNNISPLMLLPGPFLYFYMRGTLNDKQGLHWKDSLHFIPAIIHFIGVIPYYITSFSYKLSICKLLLEDIENIKKFRWNVFFTSEFNFSFRIFLLFGYLAYCMVLLWKFTNNRKKLENIPVKQYSITIRWLKFLLLLILLLNINYVGMTFYFFKYYRFGTLHNVINISTIVSFGLLVSSLLFFPEVLYGLPRTKKIKNKKKSTSTAELSVANNNDEQDPFLDLYEKIKVYLDRDKPYLNSNFSIAQISIDMGVPQNHVSYCINTLFNTKFSKLRTQLRVEQTKVLLYESKNSKITIDGIAQMVGFTSRSSFYNAFKEETGVTPSDYLKLIEMDDSIDSEIK